MTALSTQLKRVPVTLSGGWIRRWERNIWEGTVSCDEPFVLLIVARVETELFWAKSLPSKGSALELQLDLFPRPDLENGLFQPSFSSGSGAFIENFTAKFDDRDYRPTISAPANFQTGFLISFAALNSRLGFSLACFAKTTITGAEQTEVAHFDEAWWQDVLEEAPSSTDRETWRERSETGL